MTNLNIQPDPKLDLVLERIVDVPREKVWAAWTKPEHLKKWFTPAPWTTSDCIIDLRPGGIFRAVMQSPEGETFPHEACYLEIVENERLSWTTALGKGYRPLTDKTKTQDSITMTAVILLEPLENRTRYKVIVMHPDEETCRKHGEMGFRDGWGAALDQLVAMSSTM